MCNGAGPGAVAAIVGVQQGGPHGVASVRAAGGLPPQYLVTLKSRSIIARYNFT